MKFRIGNASARLLFDYRIAQWATTYQVIPSQVTHLTLARDRGIGEGCGLQTR